MQVLDGEIGLEVLENRVQQNLGRELTPREKFYLAMAEACAPTEPATQVPPVQRGKLIEFPVELGKVIEFPSAPAKRDRVRSS